MRRCFLKPEIGIFEIAVMPSPFGNCATRTEEVFAEKYITCPFNVQRVYSHSTNPIIWGCISYTLTGITFANLLIFYLLFLAVNFLSIKIVSQKAGEYNYLLHRFPGYSAIENTLIYRKFSFIALDAFRSGRSRHPWTL